MVHCRVECSSKLSSHTFLPKPSVYPAASHILLDVLRGMHGLLARPFIPADIDSLCRTRHLRVVEQGGCAWAPPSLDAMSCMR
eukprot:1137065-Pelagomonas_calceolata.AAC.14